MFGLRGLKKHPRFYENVYESLSHLDSARASHTIFFMIAFTALFTASKFRPKIPWIFVLCIVGLIWGAATHGNDWSPDILLDIYPSMDGTP